MIQGNQSATPWSANELALKRQLVRQKESTFPDRYLGRDQFVLDLDHVFNDLQLADDLSSSCGNSYIDIETLTDKEEDIVLLLTPKRDDKQSRSAPNFGDSLARKFQSPLPKISQEIRIPTEGSKGKEEVEKESSRCSSPDSISSVDDSELIRVSTPDSNQGKP